MIRYILLYNPYNRNYWRGPYFRVSMLSRIYAKIKSSRIKSVLQYWKVINNICIQFLSKFFWLLNTSAQYKLTKYILVLGICFKSDTHKRITLYERWFTCYFDGFSSSYRGHFIGYLVYRQVCQLLPWLSCNTGRHQNQPENKLSLKFQNSFKANMGHVVNQQVYEIGSINIWSN